MNKRISTLDIEASGLGAESYPIEVGIVLADGSSWCSLITPCQHWTHWSAEAEAIHNISPRHLKEYGKSIKTITQELNERLQGQTLYSDCWVLDDDWLRKLFEKAQTFPLFKLRDITHIMKEEQFQTWKKIKQDVTEEFNIQRHRATNDARILQETYYRSTNTPQ